MRITDLLKKESIDLNGVVTTKKETIEKMTLLMEKAGMSKTSKNTEPAHRPANHNPLRHE